MRRIEARESTGRSCDTTPPHVPYTRIYARLEPVNQCWKIDRDRVSNRRELDENNRGCRGDDVIRALLSIWDLHFVPFPELQ